MNGSVVVYGLWSLVCSAGSIASAIDEKASDWTSPVMFSIAFGFAYFAGKAWK